MSDRAPPCPICGRPATPRDRPFCSARCAAIDLGRWFTEQYSVPAPEAEESEGGNPDAGVGSR